MSPDTCLHNVYLISGGYDRETRSVIEKSAVPVRYGFFSRLNYKEHSLIATDEFGMLCSLGKEGKKLQRINDQNLGTLALNPIPPGIARQSYFAFDKAWQTKLIEEIRQLNMATSLEPIPVTFTDKHLRPAQDEDEEKLLEHFQGRTCRGQLIPRFHVLAVLADCAVLPSAPRTLSAHREKEAVTLHRAQKSISLAIDSTAKAKAEFWVYSASGPDIKEGTYVVKVPAKAVADEWKRSDHPESVLERTFQVAFGVHTLFGDYDFQILDLPSVEDAILTHFAERYSHLLVDDSSPDKTADSPYAEATGSLERYRSVAMLLNEKRKMAVGFVNADSSDKAKQIIGASLGAIRDSNTKEVSDAADVAAKIFAQAFHSKETLESWKKLAKKMNMVTDHAAALGLVEQVMDGNAISRFFNKNKWRDVALDAISDNRTKLGRHLFFHKASADKELIKTLMSNAVSPKLSALENPKIANLKAHGLWAVDTFLTMKQIVETADALSKLHASEETNASRLHKNMEEYGKRFRSAPCTEAIARLEVLRKDADAATLATDEKSFEAVEQAARLTLNALSAMPVVGEFAVLTTLVIETLENLGSVVDLASDTVDRFLWRHRSTIGRFRELARIHALQCRAIAKAETSKHEDPHTQFRLRLIVLIGLLRLIERCGSPQGGKAALERFASKVKQYQIEGYLNHYVFPEKPFTIALSSGTPLDEIWTYACGNKETTWNDLAANLLSVKDSIVELVRGTKTVFAPLAFHKYFPIHGKSSKDAEALAHSFSLNFAGVIDSVAYSRVYVRKDKKERWVAVEDAQFTIEPGTAVRVVGIFKSNQDLTGVPMSLQIKRVDPVFNINGPVYKSSLGRVVKSLGDDIDDKGLLDYTDEKQYVDDKNAYACVFYPFYFFKHHLIQGTKPFGHIGLSGDITLDFSFDLMAGDDGKWADTGKNGRTLRMHLSTSNPLHVDMILNREFLNHKAPEPHYENMFNFPWQKFQVGGVFLRCWETLEKPRNWMPATRNGDTFEIDRPPTFQWEMPLELLVVFGAPFTSQQRWPGDPIRLPARIYTKQPKWLGLKENAGPSFPVEVFSLKRDQKFKTIGQADFLPALRQAHLWTNADVNLPCAHMTFNEECTVWATRISFKFHVESKDGTMVEKSGLRPFGDEYIREAPGKYYTYTFDLRSPEVIGLDLRDLLKLTVRGLPDDFLADTALSGDTSWVTDETRWPLTDLEKLKGGNAK